MKCAIVGYTGFVGSNLVASYDFDYKFNSNNIRDSYGLSPDLLVYSGMRAEKYLANQNPEADMKLVEEAEYNIKSINPKKLVLISTVDVIKNTTNFYEDDLVITDDLQAYGLNRYKLECWVRENYPDALIVRLPALFGKNLKKNFIYDLINVIPFMLKTDKFSELLLLNSEIKSFYDLQSNGFYKFKGANEQQKSILKKIFLEIGFSALNFTDSRNVYQFYDLSRLWDDIQVAMTNNVKLLHPATEPVSVEEVYKFLTGKDFINEILPSPVCYNFKTLFDKLYGGNNGYVMTKDEVLLSIKSFVEGQIE